MSPPGSEWHDTSEYTYTADDNSMQDDLNTGQLLDILGIVSNNMDVQMWGVCFFNLQWPPVTLSNLQ